MAAAPAAPVDQKGAEIMKAAVAKRDAWSLFSSQSNKEEAVELFDKAAAQFKVVKQWDNAARAYIAAAETTEKYLKNEQEATNYYKQAALMYKNTDMKECVKFLRIVVTNHMENNRFSLAARIYKDLAEIYEKQNDIPAAMRAYEQAADCHIAEDQHSSANGCLLKVAQYAAAQEDFKKSVELYVKIADAYRPNQMMALSCRECYYKALLCQFAMSSNTGDVSSVTDMLSAIETKFQGFVTSREGKLISSCVEAFEKNDANAFTDHLFMYDRISRLDNWQSTLYLKIKNNLRVHGASTSASAVVLNTSGGEPDLQGAAAHPSAGASGQDQKSNVPSRTDPDEPNLQ